MVLGLSAALDRHIEPKVAGLYLLLIRLVIDVHSGRCARAVAKITLRQLPAEQIFKSSQEGASGFPRMKLIMGSLVYSSFSTCNR